MKNGLRRPRSPSGAPDRAGRRSERRSRRGNGPLSKAARTEAVAVCPRLDRRPHRCEGVRGNSRPRQRGPEPLSPQNFAATVWMRVSASGMGGLGGRGGEWTAEAMKRRGCPRVKTCRQTAEAGRRFLGAVSAPVGLVGHERGRQRVSEAIGEAALAGLGRPIHWPPGLKNP